MAAWIEINNGALTVHIEGIDQVITLKKSITVPLSHVKGVTVRPAVEHLLRMEVGRRFRGIQNSDGTVVGTLRFVDEEEGLIFCDFRDASKTVAIELAHDQWRRLVVELSRETPEEAKARVEAAL